MLRLAVAALLLVPGVATAKRAACPPAQTERIAAIIADAAGNIGLLVATFRGRMPTEDVRCWAATGDKRMQWELGRRLENGDGIARDVAAAEELYEAAGAARLGTIYVYSPGINGAAGTVLPIRTGPDVTGLPEAQVSRALLHIEGRAAKPNYRKGRKILERLAKAGHTPAIELIAKYDARRV
ncbi:sel1 repeat family protein [Glacieibacterium frigidum]|uniref:Sel1 repeat family protein n=1 Tax=Glacieibacterium frigidum TaxID=2593303 RepID=A0A552U8J8_9SPHN|nr:sel1 repeat family protein [Glacieibacterium frigidum]TRW14543.1 sel1 repeat family protein [Glacieibacterium frigidum]